MDVAWLYQAFQHLDVWVQALTFATARMTGMLVVMPAFSRLGLTGILQAAAVLAFALPVTPMVAAAVDVHALAAPAVAALLLKEGFVGLMIGVVLGVPIWAAEAAGSYLDLQRGATSATLFDPSTSGQEGVTATLFGLVMTALFFGSGGLALTLRTVYESYGVWPAGSAFPAMTAQSGAFFVRLLDGIATMGLELVAPIVVLMLLTDLVIGLVSKAAPQMNVFALSLSVKNLVFAVLLVLYGTFLLAYMGNDLTSLLSLENSLRGLVESAAPPP